MSTASHSILSSRSPLLPICGAIGTLVVLALVVDQVFAWFAPLLIPMIFWDRARRASSVTHILENALDPPTEAQTNVRKLIINYRKDAR